MRRGGITIALIGLVSLSLSAPVWAAEGGGLPPFDTSLYPEQIFWLAVNFVLLYLLMSRVALPRIDFTKKHRRHTIGAELDAGQRATEASHLALSETDRVLKEARDSAYANGQQILQEVFLKTTERQVTQERALVRRLREAELAIEKTRDSAMASIHTEAGDLAAFMAQRATALRGKRG